MITPEYDIKELILRLSRTQGISDEELTFLIEGDYDTTILFSAADKIRQEYYGADVYLRGLIEFTNYCKNNCLYCGIRRDNKKAVRYRLSKESILQCCKEGYALGYRTFVLQGGEDGYYTDEVLCGIVSDLKARFPDCAVTLSIGEKTKESYQLFFEAGAERYLLRHETADPKHYALLHPDDMFLENRKRCLFDLKERGCRLYRRFL